MLDDAGDSAGAVADDAAVTGRILHAHAQERERLAAGRGFDQPLQRFDLHEGHVAVEHQHEVIVGNRRHRLLQRMARAQLLGLERPAQVRRAERITHLFAAVTVDHVDVRRVERAGGVDHVLQQRPAGERLQDLGQVGSHALALAGGQDHDGNGH